MNTRTRLHPPIPGIRSMSPRHSMLRAMMLGVALGAAAFAVGCGGDRATGPAARATDTKINVHADLNGLPITSISVEVTGPGIVSTLVFNLPVANNQASGSVNVPAGQQRTITVHAFDQAVETH